MSDITDLTESIRKLNADIALSEKQVVNDGQSITYKSTLDLIAARDDLQVQLNRANQVATMRRRPKQIVRYHAGRGYQ
jgi:hypothetical protein